MNKIKEIKTKSQISSVNLGNTHNTSHHLEINNTSNVTLKSPNSCSKIPQNS